MAYSSIGRVSGPYMKYIVKWLSEDDILKLMNSKQDRTIILRDVIAYKDGAHEEVFTKDVYGTLLESPQGETDGPFITRLISFSDDGKSLASVRSEGYTERELPLWEDFIGWLRKKAPRA